MNAVGFGQTDNFLKIAFHTIDPSFCWLSVMVQTYIGFPAFASAQTWCIAVATASDIVVRFPTK